MKVLKTPAERFDRLPGYDFEPHYIEIPGDPVLAMHYLDEGAGGPDTPTFLCLHGQPTWSYLYRKMIPELANLGRVVVPDLIGFGKSDKPDDDDFYTFSMHREKLLQFVDLLGLENVTLVCQDWGGLLGLTLPMDRHGMFDRLLIMNTAFGTGDFDLGPGFKAWRAFVAGDPDFDIAELMQRAVTGLGDDEADAYAAPFPDRTYRAGVRRFPALVPETVNADGAEISRKAREWWRTQWNGTSAMIVGSEDIVFTPPMMEKVRSNIRGCPPMQTVPAGHFVQEYGADIARLASDQWPLK